MYERHVVGPIRGTVASTCAEDYTYDFGLGPALRTTYYCYSDMK